MKKFKIKSNLQVLIMQLPIGILFLLISILFETKLSDLFIKLGVIWFMVGIIGVIIHIYNILPKNREKYQQEIEDLEIEAKDELNTKILYDASTKTFVLGMVIWSITLVVVIILKELEINISHTAILFYIFIYLVSQVAFLMAYISYLQKKYK